ncbi:MAG: redoxin domain-containing protein [Flavobacteriales bacterium]|nr:redoxin domain-containing protein [Flavobacteriales bacterium]
MRLKILLGHLVFLLHGFLSAGTIISGYAPELKDKTMRLYSYTDFISNNLVLIDESIVAEDGMFYLEFSSKEILYVKLSCDNIAAHIYTQPGSEYEIEFPLPSLDIVRTFAKEAKTEVIFNNLDEKDINADIIDFNYNYEIFFKRNREILGKLFSPKNYSSRNDSIARTNSKRLTAKQLFAQLDHFSSAMDSIYAGSDSEYFKLHRNAVIGDLRMNSSASPREIFDAHIASFRFSLNHPEFTKLVQRFFKFYFVKNSSYFGEQSLDSALNVNGSLNDLMRIMEKDDFLENKEMKEIVACMAIKEIWNGRTKREKLAKILGEIVSNGESKGSRKVATEVLNSLTNNRKGFQLKNFEFEDQFNQRRSITDLQGKPCLIEISADWCSACQQEEAALASLIKEYQKDFRFLKINVFLDKETQEIANVEYVIHSSISQHAPIIKSLGIAKLPSYILLDKNGVVLLDKTPMPSNGLEAVLEKNRLKSKKGDRNTVGSKEN